MALNAVCLAGRLVTGLVPVAIGRHLQLRGLIEHRQRPRLAHPRRGRAREAPMVIEYEAWDEVAQRAFGLMKRGEPVVLQGTLAQRRREAEEGVTTQLYLRVVQVDALPPAGALLDLARIGADQPGPAQDGARYARCADDAPGDGGAATVAEGPGQRRTRGSGQRTTVR